MLDVSNVVTHFVKRRQRFSRDGVAQILLDLHCDFDSVEGIQSVFDECTTFTYTLFKWEVPFL